jgi:hypothetical protein
MRWGVGVMAAPRPDGTGLQKTLGCLQAAGWANPIVFAEPGTPTDYERTVVRPGVARSLFSGIVPGPDGQLGNVQNWIQTAYDLLVMEPDADVYVTVEDDALVCMGAKEFTEGLLWPSARCGAISLYAANITENRKPVPGLFKSSRKRIFGSLFMVWQKECLLDLLTTDFVEWGGHEQLSRGPVPQHKWIGVDSWLGQQVDKTGWQTWIFSPSLVYHYEPHGATSYSAVGNGKAIGMRQAYRFVGMQPNLQYTFRSMLSRTGKVLEKS